MVRDEESGDRWVGKGPESLLLSRMRTSKTGSTKAKVAGMVPQI